MPNRSPQSQQEKRERLAVEGAQAMKEYIAHAEAVNERTARLRAERLARESHPERSVREPRASRPAPELSAAKKRPSRKKRVLS